jgi:hypothetical protein
MDHTTGATRPVPLGLTLLVAFFSALAALAVSNGHTAHAHDTPAAKDSVSADELELRSELRRLWEDHIVWTRLAVISLTSGSPDTEATVARLLRNQTDIGNALKPFYGKAAGARVTRELRQHILVAADVVLAAKAGDPAKLADAQRRWRANADAIAAVLASLNPQAWKVKDLRHMLGEHLTLTTQEAVSRLAADWAADVRAYDAVHRHALGMSDTLAEGIVEQFPRRFR